MILLSIIGGILYRMRGGWPDWPRPIEQMLFCLPVLVLCLPLGYLSAACLYAVSVAACCMGHGHNMDLGSYEGEAEYEVYEKYTGYYKLHGKIPEYWYDVGGVAISGLLITLPLIFVSPVLAFSGVLKAPAYMIGWLMHPNYDDGKIKISIGKFTIDSATAWGEFLTGVFIWGSLILGV